MHHSSKRSHWLAALSVLLVGLVVVIAMASALAPSLLTAGDRIGGEGRSVAAGVIFVGSYLALAIGRIPGLSIDRAGIALVGAGLMVASGALPLEGAYKAIDLDTITLLLGMMIVVANLRLSGFFAVATAWLMAHASRPLILLGCGRRKLRRLFCFPSERRDLLGADPARTGIDGRTGTAAGTLSVGRSDGVECWVNCNDHRQPAEHYDR